MIRVLFVCLGNICRSPMAEGLFKQMVVDQNIDTEFCIESRATSTYEIGNQVHPGTKKILDKYCIDSSYMRAKQITTNDFYTFDYILCMDDNNLCSLKKSVPSNAKVVIKKLLDYTNLTRKDISDPWYTGKFEQTYEDVYLGLTGFLNTVYFK